MKNYRNTIEVHVSLSQSIYRSKYPRINFLHSSIDRTPLHWVENRRL